MTARSNPEPTVVVLPDKALSNVRAGATCADLQNNVQPSGATHEVMQGAKRDLDLSVEPFAEVVTKGPGLGWGRWLVDVFEVPLNQEQQRSRSLVDGGGANARGL